MSVQHKAALQVIVNAYRSGLQAAISYKVDLWKLWKALNEIIPLLLHAFNTTHDRTPLFQCLVNLFHLESSVCVFGTAAYQQKQTDYYYVEPIAPTAVADRNREVNHLVLEIWAYTRQQSDSDLWLPRLASMLLESSSLRHADPDETRKAVARLTYLLLQMFPRRFPSLIFDPNLTLSQSSRAPPKPAAWTFVLTHLVQIKVKIEDFIEELDDTSEYTATATRLCGCYEVLAAFTLFIAETSDHQSLLFSPEILEKVNSQITIVLNSTIEHLRDRRVFSPPGAAGLHPSTHMWKHYKKTAHPIAWESINAQIGNDSLIMGQIKAILFWLRNNDSKELSEGAASIMDLLLGLYVNEGELDFRWPILLGLGGILANPQGVDAFLFSNGWGIFACDLERIIRAPTDEGVSRGIYIAHHLETVVLTSRLSARPSVVTNQWVSVVELVSRFDNAGNAAVMAFKAAVTLLAFAIITAFNAGSATELQELFRACLRTPRRLLLARSDQMSEETRQDLEDVEKRFAIWSSDQRQAPGEVNGKGHP